MCYFFYKHCFFNVKLQKPRSGQLSVISFTRDLRYSKQGFNVSNYEIPVESIWIDLKIFLLINRNQNYNSFPRTDDSYPSLLLPKHSWEQNLPWFGPCWHCHYDVRYSLPSLYFLHSSKPTCFLAAKISY